MNDNSYRPGEIQEEDRWDSSKTISHAAYKEAREKVNEEYLADVIKFYRENPDHPDKIKLLLFVEIIAEKTYSKEATDFLFNLVKTTKDSDVLKQAINFFNNHYEKLEERYPVEEFVKKINNRSPFIRSHVYQIIVQSKRFKNKKILFQELLEKAKNTEQELAFLELLGAYAEMDLLPLYKKYSKSKSIYIRRLSKSVMLSIYLRSGMNFKEIWKEMDLTHTGLSDILGGEGTTEEKFARFAESAKDAWKIDNE